jgi:protein-disulfide isomerase
VQCPVERHYGRLIQYLPDRSSFKAATAHDKFWELHDYFFEHQKALEYHNLLEYAQKVGLDVEKFKKDMSEHAYASLIEQSLRSGADSGVEGTPTFFINGDRYEDPWDLKTLSETLQKHLATQAQ